MTWMLSLDGHPPMPVTVDRVDGPITHYRTPGIVPHDPLGPPAVVRAILTAPNGSEQAGFGSISAVVWHTDRTTSTELSFTAA